MLMRRAVAGLAVLLGVTLWSSGRDGDHPITPAPAPAAEVAEVRAEAGGNYDDAAYRFRTSQARHWRHVMIGGR